MFSTHRSSDGVASRRLRRLIVLGVALVMVITTAPVGAARQEAATELSPGTWRGGAHINGVTDVRQAPLSITILGLFGARLNFEVPPSGSTTGNWELNGTTNWTLIFDDGNVPPATATLMHGANGSVEGNRTTLTFARSMITSNGFYEAGAETAPVNSIDPLDAIDLTFTSLLCNDAWGEWRLSWNLMLSSANFSPTFDGNWHATRRSPEFEGDPGEFDDMVDRIYEIRDHVVEIMTTWSTVDGVPYVGQSDLSAVGALIQEAIGLINELRNLSECDRSAIGDETVEQWINALSNAVADLSFVVLANINGNGQWLEGPDLMRLTTMLMAVGALGAGSPLRSSDAVERELADMVDRMIDEPGPSESDRIYAQAVAQLAGLDTGGGG